MISIVQEPSRRQFVTAIGGLSAAALSGMPGFALAAAAPSVGALFAGNVDDRGFMEAGWRGLERARTELGAKTSFPKIKFVVTQGSVVGSNLASYDVLQEESAYLAGVLAAKMTRSGTVGHMSGIRVRPGLKGRAGYAAGVRATNPEVKLLTNFSGNQDDNALSKRVALAEIAAGADMIFTMLNAGRNGVSEACREKGARQIGNVIDWVKVDPVVFVASAIADVSIGVFNPVRDLRDDAFKPGTVRKVGVADAAAVRLSMADDVPADVKALIESTAAAIASGRITVPEVYDGPEFQTQ